MGNAVERRMRVWRQGFDKVPIVGILPPTNEKEFGNKHMEENRKRNRVEGSTQEEKRKRKWQRSRIEKMLLQNREEERKQKEQEEVRKREGERERKRKDAERAKQNLKEAKIVMTRGSITAGRWTIGGISN